MPDVRISPAALPWNRATTTRSTTAPTRWPTGWKGTRHAEIFEVLDTQRARAARAAGRPADGGTRRGAHGAARGQQPSARRATDGKQSGPSGEGWAAGPFRV